VVHSLNWVPEGVSRTTGTEGGTIREETLTNTTLAHARRRVTQARRAVRFYREVDPRDFLRVRKLAVLARIRPFTMLSYRRLSALYDLGASLSRSDVPGAIVECGVWNGGSAAVLAQAARDHGEERDVWLFDSWEGLPEPDDIDTTVLGTRREKGWNLGSEDAVRELFFRRLTFDPARVHLVKGWFEETLPRFRAAAGPISLVHLDGDWYRSTRIALEQLYDLVVPGGIVAVDDYGHWKGARKAVDEFIAERSLPSRIAGVECAVYLRKPRITS
jgi:O-methyltransferase